VARAAVPGRLSWRVATIKATRDETASARTLILDVPGWTGHLAGQHVDVKLTADDGYSAQRSYSIASAPEAGRLELTVQRLSDGEVSPYLTEVAEPGDQFQLRGPIGGWFVWHDTGAPLLLIAGGSGVVPLMSMIRARDEIKSKVPVRLIYSVRAPADIIYRAELDERARGSALQLTYLYTRTAPAGVRTGRINADVIAEAAPPASERPTIYLCGPSGFVEAASSLLIAAGHAPDTIKTERFGPTS